MTCSSFRCPVLNCIDPVYELGKCCPSCSSDKCIVEGRTYRSGDSFCLPSDPCQECHCIGSKATCAKRECPETRCRNPAFLAGKCCPECKGQNSPLIYITAFYYFSKYRSYVFVLVQHVRIPECLFCRLQLQWINLQR